MPDDYSYRPRPSASASAGAEFSTEQAAALITRYESIRQPKKFDGRCPYVGAAPFQEADARLYFGNENQLEALLDRMERQRFICLLGPESVGKTSLVQAGLFFALRNGAILDSDKWLIHTFTPGDNPLQRLADASALMGQRAGLAAMVTDAVRKRGLTGPNALHNFVDMLLGPDPRRRAVLVVDQFEEIFTKTKDEADRRAFANFVAQTATEPASRLILLLAMRSEFLPHLAPFPELAALVEQNKLELAPMEPNELARAIILPALEAGVKIEPQLVARLVNDVHGDPTMLPKLQNVLRSLFNALPHKQGTDMVLRLTDYIDFGPLQPRPEDVPATAIAATAAAAAPAASTAARAATEPITSSKQVSYFAGLERRVKTFRIVAAVCVALALLLGALAAFALLQSNQANQAATAAATAQALAQAEATRAIESASAADIARSTAEAQAALDAAERDSAIATRAVAEAASTRAAEERAAALDQQATAVAIATSVVNREQNAVQMEATISAVATRAGAEVLSASAAKATAEADLNAARSRELAAVALTQLAADPQLAFLIAAEAERIQDTPQSEDAARRTAAAALPDVDVFRHNGAVTDARISADGTQLLTSSRDGIGRIWDIASGEVITAFRGHVGQVTSAVFAPVRGQMATTSTDRTARVWSLESGRTITVLVGHTGVVNDAAFSPDGALLVTGGADRTARVWDLATGRVISAPIQLTAAVSEVIFLDAGEIGVRGPEFSLRFDARTGAEKGQWEAGGFPAITAGPDGTIVIQPDGGGDAVTLYGHTRPARLTDDTGRLLATASADGTARVHYFRLDELIGQAQSRLGRELTCAERVRYLSERLDCAAEATPTK